jgi:hypothetical protein
MGIKKNEQKGISQSVYNCFLNFKFGEFGINYLGNKYTHGTPIPVVHFGSNQPN